MCLGTSLWEEEEEEEEEVEERKEVQRAPRQRAPSEARQARPLGVCFLFHSAVYRVYTKDQ